MSLATSSLFAAVISSGLMAGLFFAWVVSVIPGTSAVDDRTYISTMQNINREIINTTFVATFLLTPVFLGLAAFASFRAGHDRRGWLLATGAVTYVAGVLAVTAGGNIPLNDALERFNIDAASTASLSTRRTSYETPWNRWHNLRTGASVIVFGLAVAATLTTETAD